MINFTRNWLEEGLIDRAITRDLEWGIKIPRDGYENKRMYVWFEAVMGYYSASLHWAKNQGDKKKPGIAKIAVPDSKFLLGNLACG